MLFGKEHVQRYQATDGAEGHDWNGTTTLLLTTTGRRSGQQYTTPLIYQRHGDDYLVVASKGGDPRHPEWYLNLQAEPTVEVQVKDRKFRAHARTAEPGEKPELWELMTRVWPDYDEYQTKTDREIPVVVLEALS
ncbi:nitroreductase family deazaflavin-dependent oxidoreductase [Nonomuraea sp. NPDC059194]|uniref:nitroreductase family deazaflavin-dependent oxidoreductase n=1 Tax=Nonomuraea sp. NPDC059194 TaxID=3346764 RepID=UPI0036A21357